jgi:predicted dehydrogenase
VLAAALPSPAGVTTVESFSATVAYEDGSLATVHYSGVGAEAMPKERIEVLRGGRSWVLDDFRALVRYGRDGEREESARRVDKGHALLVEHILEALRSGGPLEPGLTAGYRAQSVALAVLESIAGGRSVDVVLPSPA